MTDRITLSLELNGVPRRAEVFPMARLLDVLREDFGLTGTKEGCGEGECGACAVLMDGRLVNACLVPAIQARDARIRTVEGLAWGEALHAVQEAFLQHNGVQCGICTPGMLLAAADLLERHPCPSEAQVREGISGNLCRCTGYAKIVDAVMAAAERMGGRP